MGDAPITEYERFLRENRIKVNSYLNTVLWFFVVTGPAIAAGIKGGIFVDISLGDTSFTFQEISG